MTGLARRTFLVTFGAANVSRGSLSVEQMCQAAVELSDNTCATLLLAGIGGPPAMTAFWRSIGDRVTPGERSRYA
jgi:beta-lactamase class A